MHRVLLKLRLERTFALGVRWVSGVAILVGCFIAFFLLLPPVLAEDSLDGKSKPESPEQSTRADFWSFRALCRPELPDVNTAEMLSGLDRFVLSHLERQGLTFAPEADRQTLCRRLYLDLTGLPPSPSEVEQFVNSRSPLALETLVDQLLASPHFGEHWGRQWLDVTGYADSNGYIRHDSLRPLAYHFRDYVIRRLNEDKPYDRMWLEQLAGDELVDYNRVEHLRDTELQSLIATHFLRNAPDGTDNTEGNEATRVIERYAVLESLLETTMSAMFGITIDCARCHDHKFDPIPQRDYYALQAVFYPAFNVRDWVQPKNRWIYAAGKSEVAEWRASEAQCDRETADLRNAHRDWIATHGPPGHVLWQDCFDSPSLSEHWSATVTGDEHSRPVQLTGLDSDVAPGARIESDRLSISAAAPGESRWLVTQRKFDWTPDRIGDWIQVNFDLLESRGPDGQPVERIGYYVALHDYDDSTEVKGGNILVDGNPAGGASVVLDYPGNDQLGLGHIGTTGYRTGRRYGVRITRTADDEFLLQHLVDENPETESLMLKSEQLPDGAFGFELCCSRSFVVDNVIVDSSAAGSETEAASSEQLVFREALERRGKQLEESIALVNIRRRPEPAMIAWATDLSEKPPEVPLLKRGDYFQPGDPVDPGSLSVLSEDVNRFVVEVPSSGSQTTGRRLAFARWATRPNSRAAALLARVQADRIWRGHFGQGLVPTPENFGASGVGPTHPELLEWLAAEFIASGWRQKALHRMIVLSRTYRQSGSVDSGTQKADPRNSSYSRFPVHRLTAEQIRDSMLAVAGVLNRRSGGPAVETVDPGDRQIVLPAPKGAEPNEVDRRSIYIRYRRSEPLTFLKTFDQASPDPNCVSRQTSTVVAQSLEMLNGGFAVRMGQEFAQRVLREAATSEESLAACVQYAFQTALNRDPTSAELTECVDFLTRQISLREAESGTQARQAALADFCRMLLASNEFLYLQ
jgi:hypothetical protein